MPTNCRSGDRLYTLCLNASRRNWKPGFGKQGSPDAYFGEQYAIAFSDRISADALLEDWSWVRGLLGSPLYVVTSRTNTVLCPAPQSLVPSPGEYSDEFVRVQVLIRKKVVLDARMQDLWRTCKSPLNVIGRCDDCDHAELPAWRYTHRDYTCFFDRLKAYAKEHGINERSVLPKNGQPMLSLTAAEAIEEFERKPLAGFKFVNPLYTSGDATYPKVRLIRPVRHQSFAIIDDNIERLSERSKAGIASRKAGKVCESQCVLSRRCDLLHYTYRSRAAWCQGKNTGYGKGPGGPFTKEQILDTLEWRHSDTLDTFDRETLSWIAYNSGITTRAYGHPLWLTKVNPQNGTVVFRHPDNGYCERSFSVKDTEELLRTPGWTKANGYSAPYVCRPPRLMTDEELWTYLELLNYDHGNPQERTWWRTPTVVKVQWCPGRDKAFTVNTDKKFWYGIHVNDPVDLVEQYGAEYVLK